MKYLIFRDFSTIFLNFCKFLLNLILFKNIKNFGFYISADVAADAAGE